MGWLCARPSPEHTSVSPWLRLFQAHSEGEPEKKEVSELRSELWEKEMKLTDIRLEALNSAHQLEQLRETMHNMQVGVAALPRALSWLLGRCQHTAAHPGRPALLPPAGGGSPEGRERSAQSGSGALGGARIHSWSHHQHVGLLVTTALAGALPGPCLQPQPGGRR